MSLPIVTQIVPEQILDALSQSEIESTKIEESSCSTQSPSEPFDDIEVFVVVGKDHIQFRASKQILISSSDFFEKALTNDCWIEGQNNVVTLPEHSTKAFGMFLSFIEGETDIASMAEAVRWDARELEVIASATDGFAVATTLKNINGGDVSSSGFTDELVQFLVEVDYADAPDLVVDRLWEALVLADSLQATDFHNATTDAIAKYYKWLFRKDKRGAIPLYNLNFINSVFVSKGPVRTLVAELLFATLSPDLLEHAIESELIQPEVVIDIAIVGQRFRAFGTGQYPWQKTGCHYHHHLDKPEGYKCREEKHIECLYESCMKRARSLLLGHRP